MEVSQKQYNNIFRNYPDVVCVEEICKMLDLSDKTVYKMIKDGTIPRIPGGRKIKVAKVSVIKYVLQVAQN